MDIAQIIKEAKWIKKSFKEDLAPQAIILMGLPAAGKSTFINSELSKYFPNVPHIKAFKVLNSDAQLKKVQFQRSKIDFDLLKGMNEANYNKHITSMTYISNSGVPIHFPIDYKEFETLKGHKDFWDKSYRSYYASYFGEREQARRDTEELSDIKITGTNIVIVDTTGQNVGKNLSLLAKTKAQGYTNSVVFLEIPVEYSVGRDKYRGATEGRSVGEDVIRSIGAQLPSAYSAFAGSPLVDRMLKFTWSGSLIQGSYGLSEDKKKYPYKDKPIGTNEEK